MRLCHMLTNRLALANFRALTRRRCSLALCLAQCSLLLGLCSNAFGQSLTTFDPPGATSTMALSINRRGAITGFYLDGSSVWHGFLRAPDGAVTTFQAPAAGTASGQG